MPSIYAAELLRNIADRNRRSGQRERQFQLRCAVLPNEADGLSAEEKAEHEIGLVLVERRKVRRVIALAERRKHLLDDGALRCS